MHRKTWAPMWSVLCAWFWSYPKAAVGEAPLDIALVPEQPFKPAGHLVVAYQPEAKYRAETVGGGVRHEIVGSEHRGTEDAREARFPGHAEDGADMTMGEGSAERNSFVGMSRPSPPLSRRRIPSTISRGRLERFPRVFLRMRFPSRQALRGRIVGRLLRLGMMSTW